MTEARHIEHAELVQFLDGELEAGRAEAVRRHLAECSVCLAEHDALQDLSARISEMVSTPEFDDAGMTGRAELLWNLRTTDSPEAAKSAESVFCFMPQPAACAQVSRLSPGVIAMPSGSKGAHGKPATDASGAVLRRFGWGMVLAASLAVALILTPRRTAPIATDGKTGTTASRAQLAALEVNGESFVALPYSNPDLPLNAPRIVEMQVPVSSLTAAGITLDPAMNWTPDRTVRANVLLGIDGQPLGLHVLAAE